MVSGVADRQGHEILELVVETIRARKAGRGATNREGKSYVRDLMNAGPGPIGEKITEEASELADALARESDDRVAHEAADLLFHVLVGLVQRDLDLEAVSRVLRDRFGVSGIDEKANRE